MKKKTFVLLFGLILAVGFAVDARAGDKSIADIESNPTKYENKTVTIKGIVRDSDGVNIPIIGIRGGCYKIDDGTASIWVCSENGVPTKGAELKVKGVIQSGAVIRGKNYGLVLVEKSRKFRKR
jgi:hypothetical protein